MAIHAMRTRVVIGILLVTIGILFTLRNYDLFYFPDYFFSWEYFFIFFGALLFFLSKNKTAGVVFMAIGLFNVAPELWPLVFVIIGFYILYRKKDSRSRFHEGELQVSEVQSAGGEKDLIEDVNIFGGGTKVYNLNNFGGGSVVSIFGGSDLNLLNCKLAPGENTLEITAIFGGSTIIVPSNWKVDVDVLPIFGGFGDKRRKDPNAVTEEGKILVIKGLVLFGGGEIKN